MIVAVVMMGLWSPPFSMRTLPIASAQSSPSAPSQPTAPNSCKSELAIFLGSLLSFEDSNEYWTDIFKRNRCQQDDILEIDRQIDTLLDEMREEFFNGCASPEITELQQEIRELKIELYYVRNIVPIQEDTNFKKDVEEQKAEGQDAQQDTVKRQMIERFVQKKKWLTPEEFEEKFAGWVSDYESRVETYLECPSSPWQEVATKWKEFQEGVKELMKINKGNKGADQAREEEAQVSTVGEKNSGGSAVPGFFEKFFTLRLNGVASERGIPELIQAAQEQGNILTVDEAFQASEQETRRLQREVHKAELLATYDLLYYRGSSDITHDLGTRLQSLIDVVNSTTTGPLKALEQAAKQLHEKQGKTSPN